MKFEIDDFNREINVNHALYYHEIETKGEFSFKDESQEIELKSSKYSEKHCITKLKSKFFEYHGFTNDVLEQHGLGRHISKKFDHTISYIQGFFSEGERHGPSFAIHIPLKSIYMLNGSNKEENHERITSIIIGNFKNCTFIDFYMQAWMKDNKETSIDIKHHLFEAQSKSIEEIADSFLGTSILPDIFEDILW
jgi:hypothetical protein